MKNLTICKDCFKPLGGRAYISNDDKFEPNLKYIFQAVLLDQQNGMGEIFCPHCGKVNYSFELKKGVANEK